MARRSMLRWTLPVDGSGSFLLPVVLLAAVPALVWLQPPAWVLATVVFVTAIVLGACGVVMAAAMALTMLRGEAEHPEMARYLLRTQR